MGFWGEVGGGKDVCYGFFLSVLRGCSVLGGVFILGAIRWGSWKSILGPLGFFFFALFWGLFVLFICLERWSFLRVAVTFYLFLYIWGIQGGDEEFLRQLSFLSFHFSRELGAFFAGGGRLSIFCLGGLGFLGSCGLEGSWIFKHFSGEGLGVFFGGLVDSKGPGQA